MSRLSANVTNRTESDRIINMDMVVTTSGIFPDRLGILYSLWWQIFEGGFFWYY